MGRSISIYGAHIPGAKAPHGAGAGAGQAKAGRSTHKTAIIHHAKKAHQKKAKHMKGGAATSWSQAMKKAGLSL